jgi:DNA-directed RNA polymerase specialized sigma24 family protein
MGVPASTIRGRIVRGRSRLRKLLGDIDEDASRSAISALSEFEEKMG